MPHRNRQRSFMGNPKARARNARLQRLKRAGILAPLTKQQARAEAERAAASHTIKRIATGKRARSDRTGE
jgi:hypothetical protein